MRYWQPAPALRTLVSGYHLYRVKPAEGAQQTDVFQPAGPILRFTFGEPDAWRVRPLGCEWVSVPRIALFGPTSGATTSESGAGVTVGFGILPRGWARLSRVGASTWANRIADPANDLAIDTAGLVSALGSATSDDEIPAILDAAIFEAAKKPNPIEELVADFENALLSEAIDSVEELSRRIGRSPRFTERLAKRVFGFPPKKLIRRARFLRSLHALGERGTGSGSGSARAIDYGYTDYSHFIRDAHAFLGMSPQAFLRLDNPLLRQSLALRKQVLGAPAQALAKGDD